MTRRRWSVQLTGSVLILASHVVAGAASELGNVLVNPGLEEGFASQPTAWHLFVCSVVLASAEAAGRLRSRGWEWPPLPGAFPQGAVEVE